MSSTSALHNDGASGAFSGSNRAQDGNTTAPGGAGGQFSTETTARTEGHTLGNDFSLRGIEKQTGREGDHVEPNVVPGESGGTAGPGGDYKHTDGLQGHEAKGLKQRLERDDEREDREAQGYDEPENRKRRPADL